MARHRCAALRPMSRPRSRATSSEWGPSTCSSATRATWGDRAARGISGRRVRRRLRGARQGAFLVCKYGLAAHEGWRQHHHHVERAGCVVMPAYTRTSREARASWPHAQRGEGSCASAHPCEHDSPGAYEQRFSVSHRSNLSDVLGRDAGKFFDELIPLGRHAEPDGNRARRTFSRIAMRAASSQEVRWSSMAG